MLPVWLILGLSAFYCGYSEHKCRYMNLSNKSSPGLANQSASITNKLESETWDSPKLTEIRPHMKHDITRCVYMFHFLVKVDKDENGKGLRTSVIVCKTEKMGKSRPDLHINTKESCSVLCPDEYEIRNTKWLHLEIMNIAKKFQSRWSNITGKREPHCVRVFIENTSEQSSQN